MVWEREHGHTVALVLVRAPTRAGAVASRGVDECHAAVRCIYKLSWPTSAGGSLESTQHDASVRHVNSPSRRPFIPFASWEVPPVSGSCLAPLSLSLFLPRGAASPRPRSPPPHMSEKQPAHPVGATVACGIHYLAKVLVTSSCHRRVDMARWQLRRPWRRQEYSVRHTAYSVQYTPRTRARAAAFCEPPLTPKRPL